MKKSTSLMVTNIFLFSTLCPPFWFFISSQSLLSTETWKALHWSNRLDSLIGYLSFGGTTLFRITCVLTQSVAVQTNVRQICQRLRLRSIFNVNVDFNAILTFFLSYRYNVKGSFSEKGSKYVTSTLFSNSRMENMTFHFKLIWLNV